MIEEVIPLLLGGLALFLYAISQLSEAMKDIFSDRAKEIIDKRTKNLFSSILIGTILTVLLDSSSAVIILTIVFINAKTLSFKKAIGIIMGANIGTTFSSQIIAMNIAQYAVIPLFVGLVFEFFAKSEKNKRLGKALLFFGMLFFGLFIMESSVVPLQQSSMFEEWIARIDDNYIYGALIGGLVTLILQSSSGTVGIAIVLGKQQILSLAGGISIMLGAELGTCSDTLIATVNGSRQALKAGLFHLIFNFLTIIIGLFLFAPFVSLVESISIREGIGSQIANAHMIFNIAGVIIFIPFVSLFEKFLNQIIREKTIINSENK